MGVVHDYKEGLMKIGSSGWFRPERNEKGHYILDLMMYQNDYVMEDAFYQSEFVHEMGLVPGTKVVKEKMDDVWNIEPVMEESLVIREDETDKTKVMNEEWKNDDLADRVVKRLNEKKKLKFFEVYVDEGNLAVNLATQYPDVEASTFSLPEWNFEGEDARKEFVELLREVSPDFVWIAPPRKKWSAIQRLNRRTEKQRRQLEEQREKDERTHLSLVPEVAKVSKENESHYAMEHPHGADSWKTTTVEQMKGYYEGICKRCRTGLRYEGEESGPVRK